MPGILQQPKKFFDDNNLMAKDVMTEDYGFPTLHHITTETSLKELPGQVEKNILHPLAKLVDAGLTPNCRIQHCTQVQGHIKKGTATKTNKIIHKDVYMTPAPSIAIHHSRVLIEKRIKLRWHMCHSNNEKYTTFHQVVVQGTNCNMFVKTWHSVPSDAIYESDYDGRGKLVGWLLVWSRNKSIEWQKYMCVDDGNRETGWEEDSKPAARMEEV